MRMIKNVVVPIVLGIVLIFGGISQLGDSSVKCGGKTQSADQVCVSNGERRTLGEQRDENRSTGWVLLGLGVVFLIGGGVSALVGSNGRNRMPVQQPFVAPTQFAQPQQPQPGPVPPNRPYTPQQYSQSFSQQQYPQQWR